MRSTTSRAILDTILQDPRHPARRTPSWKAAAGEMTIEEIEQHSREQTAQCEADQIAALRQRHQATPNVQAAAQADKAVWGAIVKTKQMHKAFATEQQLSSLLFDAALQKNDELGGLLNAGQIEDKVRRAL